VSPRKISSEKCLPVNWNNMLLRSLSHSYEMVLYIHDLPNRTFSFGVFRGLLKKLTWVVEAEILSLATVLFAFGPQVRLHWTLLVWLQNEAEDLFARPQSHGLMDTHSKNISARPQTESYVTSSPGCSTFMIAGRGREILTFSSWSTRIEAINWQDFALSKKVSFSVKR